MWQQVKIKLSPKKRGFHLISDEIIKQLNELREIKIGVLHLHIQHTSASLTINENADPTVRTDFETWFNRAIPDGANYFIHQYEGPDDMPAHIKASLLGHSVTAPISDGQLQLGMWQGIYLGEHRDYGGSRTLIATIHGESY